MGAKELVLLSQALPETMTLLASGATLSVTGVDLLGAKTVSPAYLAVSWYCPPGRLFTVAEAAPLFRVNSFRLILAAAELCVASKPTSPEGVPPLPVTATFTLTGVP